MASWAWLATVGVAGMGLIGLFLAILSLRGRRVGEHPHCRRCGFNVLGNTRQVCTECGADLTARRATRTGQRQRRVGVVLCGLALLMPALLIGGGLAWSWATEVDWQSRKPVWWLARDLDSSNAAVSNAAVAELHRRMTLDELSVQATSDVVEWVLAKQADPSVKWKFPWGNLVEIAFDNGKVSDEQWDRYARNTLVPSLAVRPRIRVGDPLPMRLEWEKRFGDIYQWEVYPLVDEVSVGGVVADGKRERGSLAFARSGSSSVFQGIGLEADFTRRVPAGAREARVDVELLLRRGSGSMDSSAGAFEQYQARQRHSLLGDIDVRSAESDPSWLLVREEERLGMLRGLSVASLALDAPLGRSVSGEGPGSYVTAVIDTGAPRRAGHRLVVIAGGRIIETRPGGMSWSNSGGGVSESGYTVDVGPVEIVGRTPATVTVVLLPDPEAAKRDLDAAAYWGEAMVFRNVPVTDAVRNGSPTPPYFSAAESIAVGPDGGVPQWLINELSNSTTRPTTAPATQRAGG